MKGMYAIYDEIIETYNAPFLCENDAVATRSFYDGITTIEAIKMHKNDLKLYKVGTFNEETGAINPKVELITTGRSFMEEEKE